MKIEAINQQAVIMPGVGDSGPKAEKSLDFLAALLAASGMGNVNQPAIPYPDRCCVSINDEMPLTGAFNGPGSNGLFTGIAAAGAEIICPAGVQEQVCSQFAPEYNFAGVNVINHNAGGKQQVEGELQHGGVSSADFMLPQASSPYSGGNKVILSSYQYPADNSGSAVKDTGNVFAATDVSTGWKGISTFVAAGTETGVTPTIQEGGKPQQLFVVDENTGPGHFSPNTTGKNTSDFRSQEIPGIWVERVAEIINRTDVGVNNPQVLNAPEATRPDVKLPGAPVIQFEQAAKAVDHLIAGMNTVPVLNTLETSRESARLAQTPGIHMEPVIEDTEQKITIGSAIPVLNRPQANKPNIQVIQFPGVESEQLAQLNNEAKPKVQFNPAASDKSIPLILAGRVISGAKDVASIRVKEQYPQQNPANNGLTGKTTGGQGVVLESETAEVALNNSFKDPGPGTGKLQQLVADVGIDGGKTAGAADPLLASGQNKPVFSSADTVPVKHMPQFTASAALRMIDWSEKKNSPASTVIRLKLQPEHLGEMTVRLTYNKGELTAHFYTSSAMARDAVEGTLPQLRETLSQQNIQLSDAAAFVGRDNNHQQGQGGGYRHSSGSLGSNFTSGENTHAPEDLSRYSGGYNEGLNLLV